MGSLGALVISENAISKTLLRIQIAAEIYQISPELSPPWSIYKLYTFGIFEILKFEITMIFYLCITVSELMNFFFCFH